MKRLFIFALLMAYHLSAGAQALVNYDKEKLFEYYQSQRYAEAAAYLQSVYPVETEDIKILGQIAYCYMMAGKLPEAEKNYLKVLDQQPTAIPVLFSLANINVRRGNDLKARGYYESIIKLDSNNFNAYKQLADLYSNEIDSQKVSYLFKANHLNPIDADVAYDLSRAYRKLKDYEPAYRILTIAIIADTGNLILQQAKLPVALQLKKYDEVINLGKRLLVDEADANVIKDVAMAYYYLKNYEKTISYFKMLEVAMNQTESSLYFTALSYRALKNYALAAVYAKKTIEEGISPNTSSYYALLGSIYENSKQLSLASSAYKKGLQFKANPVIYYNLGILYDLTLKQKNSALNYYNLYLKSKPDLKAEKAQIDYVKSRIKTLKNGH
ncbi:MAG: tetratricopeptide repeat protein [Bacteroidota bacterium]